MFVSFPKEYLRDGLVCRCVPDKQGKLFLCLAEAIPEQFHPFACLCGIILAPKWPVKPSFLSLLTFVCTGLWLSSALMRIQLEVCRFTNMSVDAGCGLTRVWPHH